MLYFMNRSFTDLCRPMQKKSCGAAGLLLYLCRIRPDLRGEAPSADTVARCSLHSKGVQHRMQSVLLVSAIIAGLGVSLGLAVLFLRIAFRLLGRAPAD